ncbi:hypothetical protein [Microbacterium phyllosphaerae]
MHMLRLAGAPGAGKSAVAWAVARELSGEGAPVGYVDIDQLGMCYPAPLGDADRWTLKEDALRRVAAQFRREGIERLVVSGVAAADAPPPAGMTSTSSVWLDADEAARRERLEPRGWADEQVEAVVAAGTRDASAAHPDWLRLDTSDGALGETVRAVRASWESLLAVERGACSPTREAEETVRADVDSARVIWITGPRCVGASRVGWEVVDGLWRDGRRTGFLDIAQLGFVWRASESAQRDEVTALRNASATHGVFASAGAQTLIAVSPLEVSPGAVRDAFPGAELSFFRLDADDATLRARANRRAAGDGGPVLAGDDINGADPRTIDAVVRNGARQRRTPLRLDEHLLDTTGREVAELAAVVRRMSGLPD